MVGVMMKKSALRKDLFMEIRKSLGRFLSIFLIVALGVSILVGIRGTKPDMILSGDAYVDENRLMDIKVVSTYGFTKEDVSVIEKLPSIEKVEGSFSIDALCTVGEDEKVLHVISHTEDLNRVTVTEGRLPEKNGECLVDQDFLETSEYNIGDEISLKSGTDTELQDSLKDTKYKIVGSGNTPLYFASDRGSTTIGNGNVSGFLVVNQSEFVSGIYTEIYATVEGAKDEISFTFEYENLVEEALREIKLIQNARCEIRRENLAGEAQLQIEAARKELTEKRQQAQEEMSQNEEQLKDAEWEIKLGKAQAASGRAQVESAKAQLELQENQLQEIKTVYEKAKKELQEKKADLEAQLQKAEEKIDSLGEEEQEILQETIEGIRKSIADVEQKIVEMTREFEQKLSEGERKVSDAKVLLQEKQAELLKAEKSLSASERKVLSGKTDLSEAKEQVEAQIQEGENQIVSEEEKISGLELPVWYVFDRSVIPDYEGYGENATRVEALSIVFPTIFFLVAALISLTTMTRMVEEQRLQIGTLKALGYKKSTILKKYISYALLATVGGGIVGFLVGGKLFPYIIVVTYKIIFYKHIPQMILQYPWIDGLVALLLALLCTGGATLFSCYQALSEQPSALIRPKAPGTGKRTLLERCSFIWKHLSFTWKSTLRNLFRYKKRFFMTLFGIGGCMGLVMVGFGLRDSITDIADLQYGDLQLYDSSVYFGNTVRDTARQEVEAYLDENLYVDQYMSVNLSSMTVRNEKQEEEVYLMVIDDTDLAEDFIVFRNRISKNKYTLSDDGLILTEKTADMLGVKRGDTIGLYEDGKKELRVTVTDICENYVGHYAYMTEELYEKLYGETPAYNDFLIQMKDSASDRQMERVGEELLKMEGVLNVQYTASLNEKLHDMLYALDQVIVVLVVVAGMLSFVVLYNLNNINITERRRELATLKVLGFYDMEVAAYVYRENVLLTLLGTIVGCGFGKFLHYFTIKTVEIDTAMFGRQISFQSYLIGMAITIGFSVLVNVLMYFRLKRIDMVESLKSVE